MTTENTNQTFEEKVKLFAERAILDSISKGGWVMPDYNNRIKVSEDMMKDVWNMVDIENVKVQLANLIENQIADRIVNHMASELATDIKQILSVPERRETLRAITRRHMEEIMKAGT